MDSAEVSFLPWGPWTLSLSHFSCWILGSSGCWGAGGSRTQTGTIHSHCLEEEDCFFYKDTVYSCPGGGCAALSAGKARGQRISPRQRNVFALFYPTLRPIHSPALHHSLTPITPSDPLPLFGLLPLPAPNVPNSFPVPKPSALPRPVPKPAPCSLLSLNLTNPLSLHTHTLCHPLA